MPDKDEAPLHDTLVRYRQTAEVVVRYDIGKFSVSSRLSQQRERNHTDGTKLVYTTTEDGADFSQLDVIFRQSVPDQKRYEARTDVRWAPSTRQDFSGYIGYVDAHNVNANTLAQVKLVTDWLAAGRSLPSIRSTGRAPGTSSVLPTRTSAGTNGRGITRTSFSRGIRTWLRPGP